MLIIKLCTKLRCKNIHLSPGSYVYEWSCQLW